MQHVKLKQNLGSYPAGTVFAVVEQRMYWGTDFNQSVPSWFADGMWAGPFLAGMECSKITPYCIERLEYLKRISFFEQYTEDELQ